LLKTHQKEYPQLGVDHVNFNTNEYADIQECIYGVANVNIHDTGSDDNDNSQYNSESTYNSYIEGVGFIKVGAKEIQRAICNQNRAYLDSCGSIIPFLQSNIWRGITQQRYAFARAVMRGPI
jgi:hypothetical protein